MVDAEQTYFQPAISRITLEMMRKYNKDKAIVFNTYQCYLREAFREVNPSFSFSLSFSVSITRLFLVCFPQVGTDLEQASRQNFYFGAKLVRGAYMDQERARAQALGYADPVNPSYEATTEMYHKTLAECLRRIKVRRASTYTRFDDLSRNSCIFICCRCSRIVATMHARLASWWPRTTRILSVLRSRI